MNKPVDLLYDEYIESYKKVNKCILENFGQETFNYCVRGRKNNK